MINEQEKKHKTSQMSYQWRNKRKFFQKVRHGHYCFSSRCQKSFVAEFSHCDDQDGQKMISILFLISSSYFDHIDVFLVFNFHLDENLRHVAPCQIFMTWHPCACQSWHKTLDKKFDTLAVNQYMLDWNNAASCFLLGSIIRSQSYWLGFDSMTWRWKGHFFTLWWPRWL